MPRGTELLSICSGTGVEMKELNIGSKEKAAIELETLVRSTQRSELLLSRGNYSARVLTCRGLRERSPLDFCHMVYQRALRINEEFRPQEGKGGS